MFCYQCEQTAKGTGCTTKGVCGKDENIQSLQDLVLFGLKGIAAYAYHARELGAKDDAVDAFMHEALFKTITNVDFDLDRYIELALRTGEINYRVMELLDTAHCERFGTPAPTEVATGTRSNPAILITGHDLLDLEALLRQTEGTGVDVYTHSEMLPAHAYPELNKYPHLVGNFGGAWQRQKREFAAFGGAILATTNCVLIPPASYRDRIFTTGITGLPDSEHIPDRDFSAVIAAAKRLGPIEARDGGTLTTGFHHTALLEHAPAILDLAKAGALRHIFLIGGCDGAKPGRNYFTDLAEVVPDDCLILTLACGKYRFNDLDFGTLGESGIPRLIDIGQCNNAYSAIRVAAALAEALGVGVNDLPLSLILSWFEQKAVAILLTLLHLGIKGIRLGPTPPAFVSPGVFAVLQKQFDLKLIGSADSDLAAILGA